MVTRSFVLPVVLIAAACSGGPEANKVSVVGVGSEAKLPQGFQKFPVTVQKGPGPDGAGVCQIEHLLAVGNAKAGLAGSEQGYAGVAGVKVSACLDLGFARLLPAGRAAIVAQSVGEACGTKCVGMFCDTAPSAHVFYSADGNIYQHHSELALSRTPAAYELEIPQSFSHLRICRNAASFRRDQMEVHAVAAWGPSDELGPSLPPGFDQFPDSVSQGPSATNTKICQIQDAGLPDGAAARLATSGPGHINVSRKKVSACLDASFDGIVPPGPAAAIIHAVGDACGVSCVDGLCDTGLHAEVFHSLDGQSYTYAGQWLLSRAPQVHQIDIPGPFSSLRICRSAASFKRDQLAIDAIAVRGGSIDVAPSLPEEFALLPQTLTEGAGAQKAKVCLGEDPLVPEHAIAGAALLENGYVSVAGVKVSACIDAAFEPSVSNGGAAFIAHRVAEACGAKCAGSGCDTNLAAHVFSSLDGQTYQHHGEVALTRTPKVYELDISTPFSHLRICRAPAGANRDHLALDALAARGGSINVVPSLPEEFALFPQTLTEGAGAQKAKVCLGDDPLVPKHAIAGAALLENGSTSVAGVKVSACIDTVFDHSVSSGRAALIARRVAEACGVKCAESWCDTNLTAHVFSSLDGQTYQHHGELALTRTPKVYELHIATPFSHLRVCRAPAGASRDHLAIDAIAASDGEDENTAELPDGFGGRPMAVMSGPGATVLDVCDTENVLEADGLTSRLGASSYRDAIVDGQQVSTCVDARFHSTVTSGLAAIVAKSDSNGCRSECVGTQCDEPVVARVFSSVDGVNFHHHRDLEFSSLLKVEHLDLGRPFSHIRVCRWPEGGDRAALAIDTIAAADVAECKAGESMEVLLQPGSRMEPCRGLYIDVPKDLVITESNGLSSGGARNITIELSSDPEATVVKDHPIFQNGLGVVLHLGPSLEFSPPLDVILPLHLIHGGVAHSKTLSVVVDDLRVPHTKTQATDPNSVRVSVPHFSTMALFNWSEMSLEEQQDLTSWIDSLSVSMGPPMRMNGSGTGRSCNVNPTSAAPGGATIGLVLLPGQNFWKVDEQNVTACVDAEFVGFSSGKATVRARSVRSICGFQCNPFSASACRAERDFKVFYSFDGQDYKHAGTRKLTPLPESFEPPPFQTFDFDVPPTATFLKVCRGGGGSHRSALEIDAILGDPSPCPPASSGFPECDAFCDSNISPECGCEGQWQAKADFLMSKKPAFWIEGVSTDDFYDHTSTEVQYWERLVCTRGDGVQTFERQNHKLASHWNEGAIPSAPTMEGCMFRTTGWTDVAGPKDIQENETGLNPWKKYDAVVGCHCPTDYKPNPFGIIPLYPPSYTDDGGHVCNDDSQIQMEAWVSGVCDTNHPTCSDNVLRLEGPGECGP